MREKATITLDRRKAQAAKELVRAKTISEAVDIALERLIRLERLRRDVEAYGQRPPTDDEIALGEMAVELDLADADVDYEALYGKKR